MKSGKERVKEYRQRIKANPEKYEEYLKKERERYHKRKFEGITQIEIKFSAGYFFP